MYISVIYNHINKNLRRNTLSSILVTSRNASRVHKTNKVASKVTGRELENNFCDFNYNVQRNLKKTTKI